MYLMRCGRKIHKKTVFCNCIGIAIPAGYRKKRFAGNAQYVVTNKPLDNRFVKKQGQTIIVIADEFKRKELFGNVQRTLLMADYIVCRSDADREKFLEEFEINGVYCGYVLCGYKSGLIIDIINRKYFDKLYTKSKKNVIIYSGSLAQNGLTASLMNLLSNLEEDVAVNYLITYREESLKGHTERLEKIPDRFNKIPMSDGFLPTIAELICYVLYFKMDVTWRCVERKLEKFFKREWKRYFGGIDVDTAVQFTGYEYGVIKLFEQFEKNKIIFVHNDMISEIKYRKNQHFTTLRNAYRKYTTIALVTEDMRESALEISGFEGNMKVVPNCHDYKSVLEKSSLLLEFQSETECNVSQEKLVEILESERERFITIGRFSPEKAHKRLIDAFGDYCKKYPERKTLLIIIGGRGELYEDTKAYADKTGLDIVLIRSMENPMPVLKKCDLFMLPSEYEGLGLVLLEADTLGIPVFATDILGPRCFLKEHGGILVENSREGILNGMEKYRNSEISAMNIDYEKYNRYAVNQFKKII